MAAATRNQHTGDADATPGAGGVVINGEGKVLLIRHSNGSWVFPKGHLDPGETALQAALREVTEESGVTATCPDPDTSFETNYVNSRGEPRKITWYLLSTSDRTPVMREKLFPEGKFVEADEALEQLSYAEDRELLKRVLASEAWSGAA